MAPPKKFTDEQLRQYLQMDFSQEEIARLFHVSVQAVAQRVVKLEKSAAVAQPRVVAEAVASVFDTRLVLEQSFKECRALLNSDLVDVVKVHGLLLKHIETALRVVEKLYQITELQAFEEEVLRILDECEPGTRKRILERLQQRSTVRAAFSGSDRTAP